MTYTVIFKPAVAKQIQRLDRNAQKKIVSAAEKLGDDPRPFGYKKLVGGEGFYRIRVGGYRIIYEIADDILIVTVLRIADRRDAY